MWLYVQETGYLYKDLIFKGTGYSGHGIGYNNPNAEDLKGLGPIPTGNWDIGVFSDHACLGPVVAGLSPHDSCFGRSSFFIHGDNQKMNHTASDGCIILNHDLRCLIRDSGDTQLKVVARLLDAV
jgi:hypothetical protein